MKIDLISALRTFVCGAALVGFTATAGCQSKMNSKDGGSGSAASAKDDHDHDHSHADHGPHGGHIIVLNPGHIHAEWTHNDEGLITVYLDDLTATPSEVKFSVKIGDAEPQVFAMTKSESKDVADASAYTVADRALLTHINMGEAAKVSLIVKTADSELTAAVEHADDHGHHH